MLTACYDLSVSPPTYDVIAFLCEVERERLRRGESEVEIVIVPGPRGGFRDDPFWPHSIAEREKVRDAVAVPICWLLPSVRSVRIAADRNEKGFGYGVALHGLTRQVRASKDGIRPLRGTAPDDRTPGGYLTVTLRESEHWPERNSKTDEWLRALKADVFAGWRVIVIRDTCFANERLPGVETSPIASANLAMRALLYARATVNLCISNGPSWMAMAMDAPVLMLRPTTEGLGGPFGATYFSRCGIEPGGQMPGAPPWQRLVWQDDTADQIVAAFEAYMRDLDIKAAA